MTSCTSSGKGSTPRSKPRPPVPEPDYKKMYEAIVKEHEELQKEHEELKKRYQEKRDHKRTAQEYVEKFEQVGKLLDIERTRRKEELEEKDEDLRAKDKTVERLTKRNRRLEERIKSLDSIHVNVSSPQRSNGQVGSGTRQVSL